MAKQGAVAFTTHAHTALSLKKDKTSTPTAPLDLQWLCYAEICSQKNLDISEIAV